MSELIFFIGRVCFGSLFVISGVKHLLQNTRLAIYAQSKGVPMPRVAVFLSGLFAFLGGLGIVLGIYTRFSVLLLSLFLIGTLWKVHAFWKEDDPAKKAVEQNHFLKNLALLGAALMFLSILSPWSWTL